MTYLGHLGSKYLTLVFLHSFQFYIKVKDALFRHFGIYNGLRCVMALVL